MIAALIRWSLANRFLVVLATLLVTAWGVWAVFFAFVVAYLIAYSA